MVCFSCRVAFSICRARARISGPSAFKISGGRAAFSLPTTSSSFLAPDIPMKPLSRDCFASYAQGQSALLRKVQVAKECRAPLFPLLRKMLENPLEELVTTVHPAIAPLQAAVDRDGGVMLL
jgi:hypothetical protein